MSSVYDGLPVPQPVADSLLATITQKSAFMGSGAAGVELVQGAEMGGHFYQRNRQTEDATRAEIIDGTASTPTQLGQNAEIVPILRRKRVRTSVDGVLASLGRLTESPTAETIAQSAAYWQREIDEAIVSALSGHFDPSAGILRVTHRRSVAADSAAVVTAAYAQIVKAGALLGDNVLDLSAIVVHGQVWSDLLLEAGAKATFIPLGGVLVPYINGLRVIVSDNAPVSGSGAFAHYTSFLVRPGALFVGIQQDLKEFVAVRPEVPSTVISESLHFAVGVCGTKWNVTTINPDNTALAVATNWAKATSNDKLIGVLSLVTNVSA